MGPGSWSLLMCSHELLPGLVPFNVLQWMTHNATMYQMDAAVVAAISYMGYIIDYRAQECLLNHFEPY